MTTTQTRPHETAFARAVNYIETYQSIPARVDELGPLQEEYSTLIDAFNRGYSDFTTAKKDLLNAQPGLIDVLATTAAATEEAESDPRFTTSRNGKQIYTTLSEDDIDQLPDIEYLLSGILTTSSVSMIYGESNTGKTFTGLEIAEHIARGLAWQERRVKQEDVLYIYSEGERGIKPRLQAWRMYHKLPTTSSIQFIGLPVHLIHDRQMLLDTIAEAETEKSRKYGLLVIDPYSMAATGTNQNDQMEVTKTLLTAHEIVREHDTHVMIIHHTNKSGGYNGTAAFKNHVDTMIELRREDTEDATSPIVMRCEKQRDGQYFKDIKLQLKIVELGMNMYTYEPITSCVVVASETPTRTEARTQAQAEAEAQEQQAMLEILSVHGELSINQWEKRSKESGISGRAFDKHIKILEASSKITSRSTGKKGASIYYSLVREEVS